MGAAILQNGKCVAYWSRSISPAQNNYNTMEKELLATVMRMKEYRDMLYGAVCIVYTNHKNLIFKTLPAQ